MKNEQYSWKTFDGVDIFAQAWSADGKARAAVALVHGLGEHSGRYQKVAEKLPAAGFSLNAYDLRGHGRSGGPRLFAPGYEALMRDIDEHLAQTRRRFPGLPVFLYGHSLGGAQVLAYALKRNPSLAGVVASSPLLAPGIKVPQLKINAGKLLSRIAPKMILSTDVPWDSLSRDSAFVEATRKDPLYKEGTSARLGVEFLAAGQWVTSQKKFPLPLLLMQGTGDRHVSPPATIEWAKQLSGDVTLKVWEDGRHELHNDIEKDKVVDFAIAWLTKHL
ncbi:MAG TPA: lysophospholipase [Spirochaetia bacterium]|nr:lysophospholipase [Spirochaetia bacterium]